MPFIPLNLIKVAPNRQRREFDPTSLNELIEDIRDSAHGLLHAPVLRQQGPDLYLVAGERRLRALTDIYELGGVIKYNGMAVPQGQVPYTLLSNLSPLEAWEAELSENIRRVDLTWQERAAATAEWAKMRAAQAVEASAPAPTTADIAKEIRPQVTYEAGMAATKDELIVARHLSDPDVKAAPSIKEARKIIRKKEEVKRNAELAAHIGPTFSSASHSILHGDTQEWCRTAAPAQFDIILCDPIYGMGADEFGDSGQGTAAAAHFYDDSYESWCRMMEWFAPESFRLTKPDAHLYAFCDIDRFHEMREKMRVAGWTPFRTPLIWHNLDGFRAPWPDKGPQRKYECILYAVKGDKKVNHVAPDVMAYRRDANLGHPAQKPVALLVDLLRRSAKPGDKVWDAFAGSGSTVEAAHSLSLPCTANEQDAAAYGVMVKRVQAFKMLEEGLF